MNDGVGGHRILAQQTQIAVALTEVLLHVIQSGVQVITNDPAIDLHYCVDMVIEGAPLRLGCKIEPVARRPRSLLGDVEHALKGECRALVGHLQNALEREIKGTGPVTDPEVANRRLAGMARLRKGRNPHARIEGKALGHDPLSVLKSEAHISPGNYLFNPSCHPMLKDPMHALLEASIPELEISPALDVHPRPHRQRR